VTAHPHPLITKQCYFPPPSLPGQRLLTLTGHTKFVTSVVICPDGGRIATASDDKTAAMWDLCYGCAACPSSAVGASAVT
jgi:WD40 repeat protein